MSYNLSKYMNCGGNTIYTHPGSVNECQNICDADNNCGGFTYKDGNCNFKDIYSDGGLCYTNPSFIPAIETDEETPIETDEETPIETDEETPIETDEETTPIIDDITPPIIPDEEDNEEDDTEPENITKGNWNLPSEWNIPPNYTWQHDKILKTIPPQGLYVRFMFFSGNVSIPNILVTIKVDGSKLFDIVVAEKEFIINNRYTSDRPLSNNGWYQGVITVLDNNIEVGFFNFDQENRGEYGYAGNFIGKQISIEINPTIMIDNLEEAVENNPPPVPVTPVPVTPPTPPPVEIEDEELIDDEEATEVEDDLEVPVTPPTPPPVPVTPPSPEIPKPIITKQYKSCNGAHTFGLDNKRQIYKKVGSTWVLIPGFLNVLAVTDDKLYGVNYERKSIWEKPNFDNVNNWKNISGNDTWSSVSVWCGDDKAVIGTKTNGETFIWEDGFWIDYIVDDEEGGVLRSIKNAVPSGEMINYINLPQNFRQIDALDWNNGRKNIFEYINKAWTVEKEGKGSIQLVISDDIPILNVLMKASKKVQSFQFYAPSIIMKGTKGEKLMYNYCFKVPDMEVKDINVLFQLKSPQMEVPLASVVSMDHNGDKGIFLSYRPKFKKSSSKMVKLLEPKEYLNQWVQIVVEARYETNTNGYVSVMLYNSNGDVIGLSRQSMATWGAGVKEVDGLFGILRKKGSSDKVYGFTAPQILRSIN